MCQALTEVSLQISRFAKFSNLPAGKQKTHGTIAMVPQQWNPLTLMKVLSSASLGYELRWCSLLLLFLFESG